MDKNLEIIKNNEPKQVWDQEDGDFYLLFVPEMWDQVIIAAERMANEIAKLKEQLKQAEIDKYNKFLKAFSYSKPLNQRIIDRRN